MEKENLVIITINLPELYLKNLELMETNGHINSRSDGLRKALGEFLGDESIFCNKLKENDKS